MQKPSQQTAPPATPSPARLAVLLDDEQAFTAELSVLAQAFAASDEPLALAYEEASSQTPLSSEEEYRLARAQDLLRATIDLLLDDPPAGWALATAQEHLSPYSPLLERHRRDDSESTATKVDAKLRDRLLQRLRELRLVQEQLIVGNLHRVPHVAHRYRGLGMGFDDLVQEGSTALLRAVERYDRNAGSRFGRYGVWWIQQGVLKALSFQSRTVRLPVYLAQAVHRVRAAEASQPEPMSVAELAESCRLTPARAMRAREADRLCYSIDISLQPNDEPLKAVLSAPSNTANVNDNQASEMHGALRQALDGLPPREARVLRERYGLEDDRCHTLEEIAGELGVSRERVRQLHQQAMSRLDRPAVKQALADFIDDAA